MNKNCDVNCYAYYGIYDRERFRGRSCWYTLYISLPPPFAPAPARSNVGGGCIGNVALCWRRITFINLTLPVRHIHGRCMHARGRTYTEPFAITRTYVAYSPRRERQHFCVREQSRDLLRQAFVRLDFNGRHFPSDKFFE